MLGYAWKSLGWFLAGVAVALGFLLVPLQVAAERKKLDRTVSEIAEAHRDIRALETEFDTRANLAQLERWNGDTLRLTAPAATQFVSDEGALASLDVRQAGATMQMASLVVPSLSDGATAAVATPKPAVMTPAVVTVPVAAPVPAATRTMAQARAAAPVRAVAAVRPVAQARVAQVRPVAFERGKTQTVALLDKKLLSDLTIGDLFSGARAESGRLR